MAGIAISIRASYLGFELAILVHEVRKLDKVLVDRVIVHALLQRSSSCLGGVVGGIWI